MLRFFSAIALSLVLTSCLAGGSDTDAAAPQTAGSADMFCEVWPEARSDLLGAWNGDQQDEFWIEPLESRVAQYDRMVPSEIRSEWDRARAVFNDFMDLLFTVGYSTDNIRDEHLEMMFGAEGPSPAIVSAEEAIDDIDLWAANTCGDFCARWPALQEAFHIGINNPNLDGLEMVLRDKERWEQLIAVGDILIPQEIEADWKAATALQTSYVSMVTNAGESIRSGDESALPDSAFIENMGMPPDEAEQSMQRALEAMNDWRSTHCEDVIAAQTGSGPGRLFVHVARDPENADSTLLMAVLPSGSDFGSVTSTTDILVGSCHQLGSRGQSNGGVWDPILNVEVAGRIESGDQPGEIAADLGIDLYEFLSVAYEFLAQGHRDPQGEPVSVEMVAADLASGVTLQDAAERYGFDFMEPFRHWLEEAAVESGLVMMPKANYGDGTVCQFEQEGEGEILEPGNYELFVGRYRGDPGNFDHFVPAPESCAQVPVTVGGDTTIELPALGPCTVSAVGNPQETARRTPDLGSADSSLEVRFEEADAWGQPYPFCSVELALLPTGTTLNDVGRGDVWPVGGSSLTFSSGEKLWLPDEESTGSPGFVPILPYPATGSLQTINARYERDGTWDGRLPDPAGLPKGVYDLRIERICSHNGDMGAVEAIRSCAVIEVDVRGETVVGLPELGGCP